VVQADVLNMAATATTILALRRMFWIIEFSDTQCM
jgi:hypothetical protein